MLVAGSGDGLVDAAAAGLIDGSELVRYTGSLGDAEMLRRRRRTPASWSSPTPIVSGPTTGAARRTSSASRRTTTCSRRTCCGATWPTSGCRCSTAPADGRRPSPSRRGRCGHEPAATASRSPTGPRIVPFHGRRRRPDDGVGRRRSGRPDRRVPAARARRAGRPPHAAPARRCGRRPPHRRHQRPGRRWAVAAGGARRAFARSRRVSGSTSPSGRRGRDDHHRVGRRARSDARPGAGRRRLRRGRRRPGSDDRGRARPRRTPSSALREEPDTPLSYVFTRLRTRPSDRWRSDPEPAMVREFDVPTDRSFAPAVTVRLDQRATDAVLADLLGIQGAVASSRLTGVATAAGWRATDGDPSTAWITPFGEAVGARLDRPAGRAGRRAHDHSAGRRLLPDHRSARHGRRDIGGRRRPAS